ncbi:MAG: multidrug resistance protein [Chloroflexi bacterium]|nr:multidrug resistance protein [Chloroflexota bacterium]
MTPILFLLIAIGLSATGEVLLKTGMRQVGEFSLTPEHLVRAFTTLPVVAGFAFVFGGSLFWLATISRADLSWAYPMLALGYVLVVVASWAILNETIPPLRAMGLLVICVGVVMVSRS